MTDKVTLAYELLRELLGKLGLENVHLGSPREEEGCVLLNIESAEPGMLIGYHGETLEALQTVLQLTLFRKAGEWISVQLDVGDYRRLRSEKLQALAKRSADKARFLSREIALPPMPPAERREVHLTIVGILGVVSASVGVGAGRHVVVKPEEKEV